MKTKSKVLGSNAERELREKFYKHGILSFRVAGSGSSRKTPGIDLIIIYNNNVYGIEVKRINSLKNIYLREEQLFELMEIEKYMEVWIAVKIVRKGWRFVKFSRDRIITKDKIEKGMSLEQFIEYVKNKILL